MRAQRNSQPIRPPRQHPVNWTPQYLINIITTHKTLILTLTALSAAGDFNQINTYDYTGPGIHADYATQHHSRTFHTLTNTTNAIRANRRDPYTPHKLSHLSEKPQPIL